MRSMHHPVKPLALLALSLGAIACSFGGHPAPPTTTYVLAAPTSEPNPATSTSGAAATLKIATPSASPAYASSRMAYIEQPYRIDYFAQNQWADTPSRMLKTLLTQDLAASGLFRFVHAESTGVDDGLRLDSSIVELVQVFTPTTSEVRVTIRFDLVDLPHRTILLSEVIGAQEPAATRDPYAGVVAANQAVRKVLDQLHERLRDALAGAATASSG